MMTHKIAPAVDINQWLKRSNTQLNKPTNQNSVKVPKVVRPTNKKRYCKTLGTIVINSSLGMYINLYVIVLFLQIPVISYYMGMPIAHLPTHPHIRNIGIGPLIITNNINDSNSAFYSSVKLEGVREISRSQHQFI